MKDYKSLKRKRNISLIVGVISIFLSIFLPVLIVVTVISMGLFMKYDGERFTCPHCGKSNANFVGSGVLAAHGARLALIKKCEYCGGDLPVEMF
jgi:hypothetical protein